MATVFFNLRIDETLNDRLIQISQEEGRSKNKQIEFILKEYVRRYDSQNGTINISQHDNANATVNIKKPKL